MTVSPFMATKKFVLPMYGVVLAMEGLLNGLSAAAFDVRNLSAIFICRFLSCGLLAVMLINKTVLNVEVLGKERLASMKKFSAPLEVLGGAGGMVAWVLHVESYQ